MSRKYPDWTPAHAAEQRAWAQQRRQEAHARRDALRAAHLAHGDEVRQRMDAVKQAHIQRRRRSNDNP